MEIMIVTGMSGAGKTAALKCLEDLGYYAIDNLPAILLAKIVDLSMAPGKRFDRFALVMDVRGGSSFEDLFNALDELRSRDTPYSILFLDASDQVLVRRFSETRRSHPLEGVDSSIVDNIEKEREILQKLRERADILVDTSELNIHELSDKLKEVVPEATGVRSSKLTIISFGYKFGIPLDADIILDARFLPNPYWVEELKDLDGLDDRVRSYVADRPESKEFIDRFVMLIEFLVPRYERERKTYLTIGIGCTGGRHRSVVITNELAARFDNDEMPVSVIHRDIEKR